MGKNLFNSVKMTKPGRNIFDLTHDVKLSFNMGELIPIMCKEAVPGDTWRISAESLIRFAPLVSPVMHRMDVTMHYFFVPNRILWPNWEKFITNTKLATTDLLPAFPVADIHGGVYTRLMDYLGLPNFPSSGATSDSLSVLPLAAYQAVYNEYYRDQNLIDPVEYQVQDGNNSLTQLGVLRRRAWEHDYFTAALPFAQKGEAVDIPLGDTKPAIVTVERGSLPSGDGFTSDDNSWNSQPSNTPFTALTEIGTSGEGFAEGTLYAPATPTEPTTINDLRRSFRLQEWLEKAARGGSRYIESILVHFGIKSSDKRLQRPEYITGVKSPVMVSEILNTTGTTELPQGNMAGHGIASVAGGRGNYFCEEHGFIIGIMSVMPKTAYQQGIEKMWLKTEDPFQYYWPTFANIGEQEVLNKEIYGFHTSGDDVFGYVPRYAEYKFSPSRVAGNFRTDLDFWHLGRIFNTPPNLNQDFVECFPDTRIFAVTDDNVQHLYAHVLNQVSAVRPMPKYGTPTF